ncbi:MAG TPA: DUF5686 and carboxypeptidase regulatory-like domain-containing protein [Hanamia sp.]|nr:DUF5686 and carboxypeptidase regulatory-like domain-containing protein [Hanamia sp.]
MQKLLFLLLLFSSFNSYSQNVTGTVRDADGHPLPFASILVKGTPLGVTANNEGFFSLNLSPGNYTLDCKFVGYSSAEKNIKVSTSHQKVNFVLQIQNLTLKEVIIKKGGEDPAYEIIRKAIKKRPYYQSQVKAFEAQVYVKGMIRLLNFPQRIMGQKIPEEDRELLGLDSSGQGIIYLTESVTNVFYKNPDKLKLEVVSTRVSGNNGLGFSFPAFISFYDNNVNIASQVNARGFVSPIADNALNYYNYKFLGSFFEDGNEVNAIKVIPKHKYAPLFSGIINITENDWRIFSCQLSLSKENSLEILDSLRISQIHSPVENDVWRIKNQVIHFSFNKLGIRSQGYFVNVYSKYNLHPNFPEGFFDRVVIKYDSAVNKKPHSYWDSIRPVPLEPEEIKDYQTKDSVFAARNDSSAESLDSLRKKQGPIKLTQVFWSGVNRTHYSVHPYHFSFDPLLKTIQYNTVEGVAINPSLVISKKSRALNSNVSFIADVRYGFNNRHVNPWAGFVFENKDDFDPDKKFNNHSFFVAGGKRVSQFFKESDIDGLGNSIATLLYGRNAMKIYENYFGKTGYEKEWESGAKFLIEGEYEDRLPLYNTTNFILDKSWSYRMTPNYPVEIMSSQFVRHQATIFHASFSFQPGQQYIQFPKRKMALGSSYPTFTIDYTKGIKNLFGSDVDFDKWSINIADDANLKLAGVLKYNMTVGGFLNNNIVYAQDYKHFYGNQTIFANQYVRSFQNASYYQFSNASPFYSELHFEHHANGLVSNKIPFLKKWNWNFVEGANALYINPKREYAETFIGLENIFKILRVDLVVDFQNGYKPVYTYRIGFDGLLAAPFNYQRFHKTEKIINEW